MLGARVPGGNIRSRSFGRRSRWRCPRPDRPPRESIDEAAGPARPGRRRSRPLPAGSPDAARRCGSYSYVIVMPLSLKVWVARRMMPTAAASSMKSARDAQCSTVDISPVHVRSKPPPFSACVQVTLKVMLGWSCGCTRWRTSDMRAYHPASIHRNRPARGSSGPPSAASSRQAAGSPSPDHRAAILPRAGPSERQVTDQNGAFGASRDAMKTCGAAVCRFCGAVARGDVRRGRLRGRRRIVGRPRGRYRVDVRGGGWRARRRRPAAR